MITESLTADTLSVPRPQRAATLHLTWAEGSGPIQHGARWAALEMHSLGSVQAGAQEGSTGRATAPLEGLGHGSYPSCTPHLRGDLRSEHLSESSFPVPWWHHTEGPDSEPGTQCFTQIPQQSYPASVIIALVYIQGN